MKRGVESQDHWFYIPTQASRTLIAQGRVEQGKIQRRLDCMLCWWKHRSNGQFVQHDSARMLEAMHECGEMDLANEAGRLDELRAYWVLAWICAHDTWLWDVRNHWEYTLLKWRVVHYYCHEHHFSASLLHNIGLCDIVAFSKPEDVDLIVTENYKRRFPGCPLPLCWANVPFGSMPASIMSKPQWEVRDGLVSITFRDFVPWAWHQMLKATDEWNRRIHVLRWDDELEADRIQEDKDLGDFVGPFLAQCYFMRDRERAAIRQAQANQIQAGLPSMVSPEALLQGIKSRLPLCMLQHFWLAFEKGQHPKNASRVTLAKFLLEAGYEVKHVDDLMYGLFSLDKGFVDRYPNGGWNDAAYHKKFGVQVVGLHRKGAASESGRAYGCVSLVKAGREGEARGCPFFKTAPGSRKDLIMMLDWAGMKEVDIEDIVASNVNATQERCLKDFGRRSSLRDQVRPFTIFHPNAYMRGYNKFTGESTKDKATGEVANEEECGGGGE
jgi:hypothetical protein